MTTRAAATDELSVEIEESVKRINTRVHNVLEEAFNFLGRSERELQRLAARIDEIKIKLHEARAVWDNPRVIVDVPQVSKLQVTRHA